MAAAPQMIEELKGLLLLEKTSMTKKQMQVAIDRAKNLLVLITK